MFVLRYVFFVGLLSLTTSVYALADNHNDVVQSVKQIFEYGSPSSVRPIFSLFPPSSQPEYDSEYNHHINLYIHFDDSIFLDYFRSLTTTIEDAYHEKRGIGDYFYTNNLNSKSSSESIDQKFFIVFILLGLILFMFLVVAAFLAFIAYIVFIRTKTILPS